jgi:hypothetical protein
MAWQIVGGPREYQTAETVAGSATGWSWEIESHGVRRVINADLTDDELTFEDAEAAVRDVLAEDDPPARLTLTAHGIERS